MFKNAKRMIQNTKHLNGRGWLLASALAFAPALEAWAGSPHGQYSFGAERACVAGGALGTEHCANAAANAQAEFEEKAPRFPSREACERIFKIAGCSVGFSGADGWEGKKSGVYFTPRQQGFRVVANSERDITVVPYTTGPTIDFTPRSVLKKDTRIDLKTAHHARETWSAQPVRAAPPIGAQPRGAAQFGVSTPTAEGAARVALPPPPSNDPNFDCAAVLEPGAASNSNNPGCYPAPARRR